MKIKFGSFLANFDTDIRKHGYEPPRETNPRYQIVGYEDQAQRFDELLKR